MPYTQDHRSSIETNSTGAENPPEFPSEEIFLKNFKNISENFAKPHLPFGIEVKGEVSRPLGA